MLPVVLKGQEYGRRLLPDSLSPELHACNFRELIDQPRGGTGLGDKFGSDRKIKTKPRTQQHVLQPMYSFVVGENGFCFGPGAQQREWC